jgi:hypothetical protein
MPPVSLNKTDFALLQMTVDPRATTTGDASEAHRPPVTPTGILPSKTRTADLGRQQTLPLTSERNKPDNTPLWAFLGSPLKAAALASVVWGSVAGLASHVFFDFMGVGEKLLGGKTIPVAACAALVGGIAAYFKTTHVRKQNHVYEAWMDVLKDERATLGMLRDAEAHGVKPPSKSTPPLDTSV